MMRKRSTKPLSRPFLRKPGKSRSLLIGTGRNIVPLPEPLVWRLRDPGMRIDVMQTGAAARTFNILLAENRRVAAALIAVA